MKRLLLWLLIASIPLALCGCWDYREIKKMTLVAGIGIDFENGTYRITAEIATMQEGGEQVRDDAKPEIIRGKGASPAAALQSLNARSSGELFLRGCALCVIGSSIFENGIKDISHFLLTSTELPQTMQIVAAENSAADIFKSKPQTEQLLSQELIGTLSDGERNTATAISCDPCNLYEEKSLLVTKVTRNKKRATLGGIFHLKDGNIQSEISIKKAPFLLMTQGSATSALLPIEDIADFSVHSCLRAGVGDTVELTVTGSVLPRRAENSPSDAEVYQSLKKRMKKIYKRVYSKPLDLKLTLNIDAQNLISKG